MGIIVLGVLIALAAEQAVEALHWRREITDAREALKAELDHNMGAMAFRGSERGCVDARLGDIDAWVAAERSGRPFALSRDIGGIAFFKIRTSVWEIVKTSQTAGHMSLQSKLDYAQLYDVLSNLGRFQDEELHAWTALNEYDGARTLAESDLRHIHGEERVIRDMEDRYALNLANISTTVRRLGIEPARLEISNPDLCQSLIPPEYRSPPIG